MAGVRKRRTKGRDEQGKRIVKAPDKWALAVFAALVTLAPLAFGAVDRFVQVGLLILFAGGLALRPPQVVQLSPRLRALLPIVAGLLVLKEFAPAMLFGQANWRETLQQSFGLDLPWTHHPEPGRALDGLLALALAALWFLWVRTLAARRENRPWIVWALAGSAALVAAVSFLIRTKDPNAIYGLRYTPGWSGFGPFPNRNHTACFLAMGVVMSTGATVWSLVRRSYGGVGTGVVLALVSLFGLLQTHSRGGVLALVAGLGIYAAFCLAKFRSRRTASIIASVALLVVAIVLISGGQVFSRFSAPDSAISNDARKAVWMDTLGMWQDAPFLGHGISSFASIFPLYQKLELDNQTVLHPESSWLQWLAELGLIPFALLALAMGSVIYRHARGALHSHRSFFLYAAGFATAGALLCHGAIDVPGHRWATAAFALAALGLACPHSAKVASQNLESQIHNSSVTFARRAALAPLIVACFWALPLWGSWPAWSPVSLQRRLALAESTWSARANSLQQVLPYFALSTRLHQALGLALLKGGRPEAEWAPHFALATRLSPSSWAVPIQLAQESGARSPAMAFHYWQVAIERGGVRAEEIFGNARQQTAQLPGAEDVWASYAMAHPELALEYAATLPIEKGQPFFEHWWTQRGLRRKLPLSPRETATFYRMAPRFSSPENFQIFMRTRPAYAAENFGAYARVLHAWGDDEHAWQLLSTKIREPEMPKPTGRSTRQDYERRLRVTPNNSAVALNLAGITFAEGDEAGANKVILAFAARPNAPVFFIQKSAYILHKEGQVKEAVEMMLRAVQ